MSVVPLVETLAIAQPLMGRLGISRVTDITRMDRLGLPVFASIRPRGLALHVHAGKGLAPLAAKVGALMEAIEFAVAEPARTPWSATPMAVGRFLSQFNGRIDLVDFAPVIGSKATTDDVMITVPCEKLGGRTRVQLPAELVFLPFVHAAGPLLFGWTSNGLASGNTLEEATLHGLMEVLERDCLSINRASDKSRWVDLSGLPEPFDHLVDEWRKLDVELGVRWVPNDFGVVCFQACLHERSRASVHLAGGSGAHVDPFIALSRAVCEAAQSRLSHVHGGRDDVERFFGRYEDLADSDRDEYDHELLTRFFDRSQPLAFSEVKGSRLGSEPNLRQLLTNVLQKLANVGFQDVYRYRFNLDLGGLHVVKIVVPRCEDAENNPLRMGRRLFAVVTGSSLQ